MKQNHLSDIDDRDLLAEVAARLARSAGDPEDWVTAYRDGDALRSDEVGFVLGVSADTARRRCERANDLGSPLGILVAGLWLVSLRRLLRSLKPDERAAAEARAKTLRLSPQKLSKAQ
jgi:hypothetical protein